MQITSFEHLDLAMPKITSVFSISINNPFLLAKAYLCCISVTFKQKSRDLYKRLSRLCVCVHRPAYAHIYTGVLVS